MAGAAEPTAPANGAAQELRRDDEGKLGGLCPLAPDQNLHRPPGGHQLPDPDRQAQGSRLPEQEENDPYHLPHRRPSLPALHPHGLAKSPMSPATTPRPARTRSAPTSTTWDTPQVDPVNRAPMLLGEGTTVSCGHLARPRAKRVGSFWRDAAAARSRSGGHLSGGRRAMQGGSQGSYPSKSATGCSPPGPGVSKTARTDPSRRVAPNGSRVAGVLLGSRKARGMCELEFRTARPFSLSDGSRQQERHRSRGREVQTI